MSKFFVLFCLLALLMGPALAATCISKPGPVGRGGACGGGLPCKFGSFCNKEGVCQARVKEGEDCNEGEMCEDFLECKGPSDFKKCYAYVHPGQDCSDSSSRSGSPCGTGNCDNGRCRGGRLGDACYEKDDCSNELTCTNRICTGLAIGAACESDSCVLGAYCHPTNAVCTALPTSGNCTDSQRCASGYICQNVKADDTFPVCIAVESVAAGGYCGEDAACASERCVNNYCAADSPTYCQSQGSCSDFEQCTCNGGELIVGFGKCTDWKCTKLTKAYYECFNSHCITGSYFNGSCIQRNCEKEFKRFSACSPASSLYVSLFSISLFALIASFLGKHF